jgi:hypothetical protein
VAVDHQQEQMVADVVPTLLSRREQLLDLGL